MLNVTRIKVIKEEEGQPERPSQDDPIEVKSTDNKEEVKVHDEHSSSSHDKNDNEVVEMLALS